MWSYETKGCLYLHGPNGPMYEDVNTIQDLFGNDCPWIFNKNEMNITYKTVKYDYDEIRELHKVLEKIMAMGFIISGSITIIYDCDMQEIVFVDEYDFLTLHQIIKGTTFTSAYEIDYKEPYDRL